MSRFQILTAIIGVALATQGCGERKNGGFTGPADGKVTASALPTLSDQELRAAKESLGKNFPDGNFEIVLYEQSEVAEPNSRGAFQSIWKGQLLCKRKTETEFKPCFCEFSVDVELRKYFYVCAVPK